MDDIYCTICDEPVIEIQSPLSNEPITVIHFKEIVCTDCYHKKGGK